MAIFITQKFVRVLADATNGDIPTGLIMGFLTLQVPVLAALVMPLSFFLGIMLAHGRFYADSEMAVMRACGISEWYVTRVMLFAGLLLALITASLTLWLAPAAIERQYQLEEQAGAEQGLTTLIPGRFQETANQQAVIFVQDIGADNNKLEGVFVAQHNASNKNDKSVQLVYARAGHVKEEADGSQQLRLQNGVQYEGVRGQKDYQVVHFDQYRVQIAEQQAKQKHRDLSAYPTAKLLDDPSSDASAELQWRISLPLSILFLVLIAVPLSAVDPRQGRFGKIMPGLLLYIGYFLLLLAARRGMEDGKIPTYIGLWWVHGVVLLIGLVLLIRGRPIGGRIRAMLRRTSA